MATTRIWLLLTLECGRWQRTSADSVLVDEVAARAIGAVAKVVEGSAGLRLVLGVAVQSSQLCLAVGKLAFTAVLAAPSLLEAAAQLRLVTIRGHHGWNLGREGRGGREAWRWSHGGSRGKSLMVLHLSERGEQAAAGLGQAHGAVGPEGELFWFGDRPLAPDVG